MFQPKALPLAIALAVGSQTSIAAQDISTGPTLQKVVVTAQKREQSVQDVAATVAVQSGEKIRERAIASANEVANYSPNVSAGTSEGHGRPRWWIRGLGAGAQGADIVSPVGIYVDDVYIANISATGFPLFDQDRVEVLRGPQGTLWGKNTTGGAIHFISKKPSFEKANGYAKVDLGNYNNRVLEGAYGDTLIDDKLAARLSLRTHAHEGYNKNLAHGNDRGNLEDHALRLQFLAALSDTLDAQLNLHSRSYHDTAGNTSIAYGTRPDGTNQFGYSIDPKKGKINYDANYKVNIEHNGIGLNLNKYLGDYQLASITAFEDFRRTGFADSDNTPLPLRQGYSDATSKQFSQELRLTSPKDQDLSWVLGAHYFHETIDAGDATANTDNSYTARLFNRTDYEQTAQSFAVFGSATYQFTERVSLTAGLRWTRESKDIDLTRRVGTGAVSFNNGNWWSTSSVVSPVAVSVRQDDDNTWSDYTYDLSPQWEITDNARVYARYAKGFRSGGYDTGVTAQSNTSVVDPEYLTSYELGLKSEWLDGRLNFNSALFYYDYEDIQLNIVGYSGGVSTSHLTNGAKAEVYGAEFDIEAIPVENLHVSFGLGLLHAEFKDYSSGGVDYSGNKLVRAPDVSAVLAVDYRIPLNKGAALVLSTDWNTRSEQFFFSNNQTDSMKAAGYTLGNARATYHLPGGKTSFTGYVNNLTDKQYRNHTLPSAFDQAVVMYGAPRTFGVSATTNF